MRYALLFALVASSCAAEPEAQPPQPLLCTPLRVRACHADCGRALEECQEDGRSWGDCKCVVFGTSFEAGIRDASAEDAVQDAVADGADAD